MAKKTYYDILGVPENADEKAIRKAYRKAISDNHPDLHQDKSKKKANRRTRELNAALATLTDPATRQCMTKNSNVVTTCTEDVSQKSKSAIRFLRSKSS